VRGLPCLAHKDVAGLADVGWAVRSRPTCIFTAAAGEGSARRERERERGRSGEGESMGIGEGGEGENEKGGRGE